MRIRAKIYMEKNMEFETVKAFCEWMKEHDGQYNAVHAETVKAVNIRQGRDTDYELVGGGYDGRRE